MHGLTGQMRRAAISIASNIAEGRNRGTRKDFVQFLRMAAGSAAELQTQLIIAREFYPHASYGEIEDILIQIEKMLASIIRKLKANS
jgi:four helix bundle protein